MTDQRRANLTAALGFLQLPPRAPELQLLHRWLDNWTGVGLITVGVERLGYRLSLSHITEGEWRAQFMADPMISAAGYVLPGGVAHSIRVRHGVRAQTRSGTCARWAQAPGGRASGECYLMTSNCVQ